ncbi:MAG: hypothetical protein PHO30_02975 [Candidatus Omnitrophica bacterium]|nr:hypothetical protein [Candidatus Omnitrophota bacterium]
MNKTKTPKIIATILLALALNPYNPYGYYVLLRWVCCAIFVFLTITSFENKKENWIWIFGVLAFIYNPIIRIHLNKFLWTIINLVSIVTIVLSLRKAKEKS